MQGKRIIIKIDDKTVVDYTEEANQPVDPSGRIQVIEITAGGIGRDATELLRKVKAAQYVASHPGEVCPAKWKEGDATLAPSLDLVGKI